MSRHSTDRAQITAADVRRFLLARPGQRYTATEVAREFERRAATVRPFLEQLVELGVLDCACPGAVVRYFAPTAPRPARDVSSLTTGPLRGYDTTLFSHARLAMLSRT